MTASVVRVVVPVAKDQQRGQPLVVAGTPCQDRSATGRRLDHLRREACVGETFGDPFGGDAFIARRVGGVDANQVPTEIDDVSLGALGEACLDCHVPPPDKAPTNVPSWVRSTGTAPLGASIGAPDCSKPTTSGTVVPAGTVPGSPN